jgi:hypothetical protein
MSQWKKYSLSLSICLLALVVAASAQAPIKVYRTELSVPFGVAKGRVVLAGDMLVFVDEDDSNASFSIEKLNVKNWNEADGVVTVNTVKPVRDRSGERTLFPFRFSDGNSAGVAAWLREAPQGGMAGVAIAAKAPDTAAKPADAAGGQPAAVAAATKPEEQKKIYSARQKRFPVGSTDGKLVITDKMVAFESLGDVKRSRQWELKDIKEIKQTGPYVLIVTPFSGDKYTMELQGDSIPPGEFKALTDRIAAARVGK